MCTLHPPLLYYICDTGVVIVAVVAVTSLQLGDGFMFLILPLLDFYICIR